MLVLGPHRITAFVTELLLGNNAQIILQLPPLFLVRSAHLPQFLLTSLPTQVGLRVLTEASPGFGFLLRLTLQYFVNGWHYFDAHFLYLSLWQFHKTLLLFSVEFKLQGLFAGVFATFIA